MSKLIEAYGLIIGFFIFVLIIIGVCGIGIWYKPLSDASMNIVEIIETNEGMNNYATQQIDTLKNELVADIEIVEFPLSEDYKRYEVSVSATVVIPIIKLEIPLTSSKTTKRVIY